MKEPEPTAISDVSDTALWVAALRADEAQRADAAFQEPLAALLAGMRGAQIARAFPDSSLIAWAVVIRTCAIDRLIHAALAEGVDTVINLGAGMDTRPYRLQLPPGLRWIEIDLPALVAAKDAALAGKAATCNIERIGLNLLDRAARNSILAAYGAASTRTLLLAEGLIPYWSAEDVAVLAGDLRAIPSFHFWILDFDNAGSRRTPKSWARRLMAAPFLFQVADWFTFFEECAWRARKVITSGEESERLNRPYPGVFPLGWVMHALPRGVRRRVLSVSGAVMLERSASRSSGRGAGG